jgi:putative intracellular protease/amidase
MYAAGKIVASVCHGPVCLVECVKPDVGRRRCGHDAPCQISYRIQV